MKSADYLNGKRKQIALPSGASATVRKLNQFDFMEAKGFPSAIAANAKKRNGAKEPETVEENPEMLSFGLIVTKLALTKACDGIQFEDAKLVIVDKAEAGPGEITINDLDQADGQAIINAVNELSGLTKGAAQAAATFSESSKATGGESGSDRAPLPGASYGIDGVVPA